MKRRNFIVSGTLAAGAVPVLAANLGNLPADDSRVETDRLRVNFTRDGLDLTIPEYSDLLANIVSSRGIGRDDYSRGGVVEELELRMAEILGKESAIFMPTGTLANHIAIRKLAGTRPKVVVQADSHIFRDSGDCATNLSGLNLVPLRQGKVGFSLSDVEEVVRRDYEGRVKTGIGAISIESPVRRFNNQLFDFSQMEQISEYARDHDIKMHLDGARIFNASVHTGKSPSDFARLFDTVYVSLYKDFNAASGAILAGTSEFTKDLYHMRRMFGGGMPNVWPFAAVALYYLDGFLDSYKESLEKAAIFFRDLRKSNRFEITELDGGSNVFLLKVKSFSLARLRKNLEKQNIFIPSGNEETGEIYIKINPSLLRQSSEELAEAFVKAID